MNVVQNIQVGARFKFVTRKASTNEIARESEWVNNIVLDAGLNRMTQASWFDRICVGTGNSEPAASQSSLDSFLASTTTIHSRTANWDSTTAPTFIYERITWRFAQGMATGNISEVGLGWANNALWNRALIRDISGNPTTITVLSDEYLDVVCEIKVYPSNNISGTFELKDKTGNTISSHNFLATIALGTGVWGNASKVELNAFSFFQPNGRLGSISNSRSNSSVYSTVTLGLDQGNTSHSNVYFYYSGLFSGNALWGYKVNITPPISKSDSQTMTYSTSLNISRL